MRRVSMDERLFGDETAPRPDTAPEVISLGEVPMVREESWREVHRRFHVERQSKSEIARQLALDRKTMPTILREAARQPYRCAERTDTLLIEECRRAAIARALGVAHPLVSNPSSTAFASRRSF